MSELLSYSHFFSFFMAAVLGALVGIEKEIPRKLSKQYEGVRKYGGVRSYALISLLGAICAWIDMNVGGESYFFSMIGLVIASLFILTPYIYSVVKHEDLSFASEYGAIITYFIGIFVMMGHMKFAIIFSILLTVLISSKDFFASFKKKISRDEFVNSLKFGVIAFVILPLLPDERFSLADIFGFIGGEKLSTWAHPVWQMDFLNPYGIWFFVVAMAAIGFVGYIFTKIIGTKGGVMVSSIVGGLISSTAVTAAMAEKSRRHKVNNSLYVFGTLIASCIMFLRVILIILLFNPDLLLDIAIPSLVMFAVLVGSVVFFYIQSKTETPVKEDVNVEKKVESPFSLAPALKFAAFIIGIKFVAALGVEYKDVWGEGVFYYALGLISGLADVDAITQTMAVESREGNIASKVAVYTILISVMSNNFVKGGMAWKFGDKGYGKKVMSGFTVTMIAGIIAILFMM